MKKTLFLLVVVTLSILGLSPSGVSASETDRQKDIQEIRHYVENQMPILESELKQLPSNSSLEEIEELISEHYKKHPAPKALENPELSVFDVFPDKVNKYNKLEGKTLSLNNLMTDPKLSSLGEIINFENDNSKVAVLLGETGDINIIEQKSSPSSQSKRNKIALATGKERTTGVGYGLGGAKLFTVWAEGNFSYNGKKVSVISKDGDYSKHFWGSTLTLTSKGMGKERDASIGKYKYKEVYSRLLVESIAGFKWGGVVLRTKTVEVYVGSTVNGNIYGGTK
ncbi:hypothetical protein NSQ93_22605 [Bacillus sp. FSL W8-0445]|uniref:hypothetical protein n=1 Tax=Bacillota TaxID=1239 RepID=UPI0007796686|nr:MULTISPECIES: hypothetical protein [Bacillota]KYC77033.1 hypothetical protein B4092_4770 [Bacillus licheniformis]MDE1407000.1 hypothetical protein [Bacillus licheniformis]NFT30568.1 hypothetical protein [Clostridium sporogenes]OJT57319.1 hypothetical protein BFP47_11460 [Bacillus licheniformis]OJT70039.1 hypothetical protein BFP46_05430 [Bacillus licheniformis]